MRILHYSFGLPPERSGGLTKYLVDLTTNQANLNEVFILVPSIRKIFSNKISIKKVSNIGNIKIFNLINSLPLSFFEGIKNPEDFMVESDERIYEVFLDKIKPDIIHVHTLMGIHKEFFEVANKKNIKIVFTSHDYFGMFPLPTFYIEQDKKDYSYDNNEIIWAKISLNSKSTKYLYVYQSRFYKYIKKMKKILSLFQKQRKHSNGNEQEISSKLLSDIRNLQFYYKKIFSAIDFYHFNSEVARDVFLFNLNLSDNFKVIPISNADIIEKNNIDKTTASKRIGFIGQYSSAKGIEKLIEILGDTEYEVKLFGDNKKLDLPSNFTDYGVFSKEDIDEVYSSFDILIVPSQWHETFGFTVAEALSRKKLVICSDKVGAKILLDQNNIFDYDIQRDEFLKFIENYYDDKICSPIYFSNHTREIDKLYLKVMEKNI